MVGVPLVDNHAGDEEAYGGVLSEVYEQGIRVLQQRDVDNLGEVLEVVRECGDVRHVAAHLLNYTVAGELRHYFVLRTHTWK